MLKADRHFSASQCFKSCLSAFDIIAIALLVLSLRRVGYTVLRRDLVTAFRHISTPASQLFRMNNSGSSENHIQGMTENGG